MAVSSQLVSIARILNEVPGFSANQLHDAFTEVISLYHECQAQAKATDRETDLPAV